MARNWPDQSTRDLLTDRAVQDDNGGTRRAALEALVENWPDQSTRDLFTERAVQDGDGGTRGAALEALVEKWPDQSTRDLLMGRAVQDDHVDARGAASFALGQVHSEFGHILLTRHLDGMAPYLDPLKPIPRTHIEEAAAKVGIGPNDINDQVVSLSAYLGWDITRGTKKNMGKKTARSKSGRKRCS